ncbi:Crp/Fnr family transcriptional regulator [Virgibacillus soli]|uniref:Crp/Fnr family transcriptional regulator n=1 Tax=Paracerasibacillus soli TaxID=480284 RepID=A0ABU5CNE7_9BACI|nr:Crp/Fnr family transcriptional regulator [Virgibacillus soli]MDY0407874.1 Crp/Fnr family transcriptional regulator [Virgibacillus soli]
MNRKTIHDLLTSFALFKDLSAGELEPILDIAQHRPYRKGQHVFLQGDLLTNVYFIHQGSIKIYKTDMNGREQIVNVLKSGDMFPHQGFFRKDNYPAHAEVSEDAILIYIPINQFENVLVTHPEICVKLFKVLGDIIVNLQTRLEEKILDSTHEQIIKLLLRLSQSHGEKIAEGKFRFTAMFTNRELANMIGTSRETVSRTLTKLKKQDLVCNDENGHIIIDFPNLHELIL